MRSYIDLMEWWKQTSATLKPIAAGVVHERPSVMTSDDEKRFRISSTFDATTRQASYSFSSKKENSSFPDVVFIKNTDMFEPANVYNDLPAIVLTPDEEVICQRISAEEKVKNHKYSDDPQILVSTIFYDDAENIFYVEAVRTQYSVVLALSRKAFDVSSELSKRAFFKTGTLAPLITTDRKTMLLERSADGLYSVHGGFLGVKRGHELHFGKDQNLAVATGVAEVHEEVAGIGDTSEQSFSYSIPGVTGLSFRRSNDNATGIVGTAEFITPALAKVTSKELIQIISARQARDAHEHTERPPVMISVESGNSAIYLSQVPANLFGGALYQAVFEAIARAYQLIAVLTQELAAAVELSVSTPLLLAAAGTPALFGSPGSGRNSGAEIPASVSRPATPGSSTG